MMMILCGTGETRGGRRGKTALLASFKVANQLRLSSYVFFAAAGWLN